MRALRKLFRLSPMERRLVLQALVAVPLVRVALWVLPFRVVHRFIQSRAREFTSGESRPSPAVIPSGSETAPSVSEIAWAVTAVAARVPRATCLTQALAASLMLRRYGHDATLRVGVAKDGDGCLRAHAWLESGGATILGEPEPGAFHALPPVALS